jgi:hypothetical protein
LARYICVASYFDDPIEPGPTFQVEVSFSLPPLRKMSLSPLLTPSTSRTPVGEDDVGNGELREREGEQQVGGAAALAEPAERDDRDEGRDERRRRLDRDVAARCVADEAARIGDRRDDDVQRRGRRCQSEQAGPHQASVFPRRPRRNDFARTRPSPLLNDHLCPSSALTAVPARTQVIVWRGVGWAGRGGWVSG